MRVLVLGYIVRGPLGGMTWHHLQYVLGFDALGHDVCFLEDSGDFGSCYNPETYEMSSDASFGLDYAARTFQEIGLDSRWAYFDAHTGQWHGPASSGIADICATADVLINVSGVNPVRPWLEQIPRKVFIDTDPAFTQIRHLSDEAARRTAEGHDLFLTFAENFGSPGCLVPDDGFPWKATRQPVCFNMWPAVPPRPSAPFTTVMQWDSYPPVEHAGIHYGMKSQSFDAYADVPLRVPDTPMEVAMGADPPLRSFLGDHGWHVVDPTAISRTPWEYQSYIGRSLAEFSVAKHGYVVSRSGWFSERSAAYMASGRAVVVQDTGFSEWLPAGAGLIVFSSVDEAVEGIRTVSADPLAHGGAAREVAVEYFASDVVLGRILELASQRPEPRRST